MLRGNWKEDIRTRRIVFYEGSPAPFVIWSEIDDADIPPPTELYALLRSIGFLLTAILVSYVQARFLEDWPYDKLIKNSDLVVIAEAATSEPTEDHLFAPEWTTGIEWKGQVTSFRVLHIFKGEPAGERINVLHFRIAKLKQTVLIDGLLAKFTKKREYLLFLKKKDDGRYEPVSGQIDPVLSIRDASVPYFMAQDAIEK